MHVTAFYARDRLLGMTEMITVKEYARRLGVGLTTAHKLLRQDPTGVHHYTTGKKPMVRVEAAMVDRFLNRTAKKPA